MKKRPKLISDFPLNNFSVGFGASVLLICTRWLLPLAIIHSLSFCRSAFIRTATQSHTILESQWFFSSFFHEFIRNMNRRLTLRSVIWMNSMRLHPIFHRITIQTKWKREIDCIRRWHLVVGFSFSPQRHRICARCTGMFLVVCLACALRVCANGVAKIVWMWHENCLYNIYLESCHRFSVNRAPLTFLRIACKIAIETILENFFVALFSSTLLCYVSFALNLFPYWGAHSFCHYMCMVFVASWVIVESWLWLFLGINCSILLHII